MLFYSQCYSILYPHGPAMEPHLWVICWTIIMLLCKWLGCISISYVSILERNDHVIKEFWLKLHFPSVCGFHPLLFPLNTGCWESSAGEGWSYWNVCIEASVSSGEHGANLTCWKSLFARPSVWYDIHHLEMSDFPFWPISILCYCPVWCIIKLLWNLADELSWFIQIFKPMFYEKGSVIWCSVLSEIFSRCQCSAGGKAAQNHREDLQMIYQHRFS